MRLRDVTGRDAGVASRALSCRRGYQRAWPVSIGRSASARHWPRPGAALSIRRRACHRFVRAPDRCRSPRRAARLPRDTTWPGSCGKPARFIRSMFCTSVRSCRCVTKPRNAAASASIRVCSSITTSFWRKAECVRLSHGTASVAAPDLRTASNIEKRRRNRKIDHHAQRV